MGGGGERGDADQQFVAASHPAGCRTLFDVGPGNDAAGSLHVPLGYDGETKAFGRQLARPVIAALGLGAYHDSISNVLWGQRASVCIPLQNELFLLGASMGGLAGPFLKAAAESADAVSGLIRELDRQLRVAMFVAAAPDIKALQQTPLIQV